MAMIIYGMVSFIIKKEFRVLKLVIAPEARKCFTYLRSSKAFCDVLTVQNVNIPISTFCVSQNVDLFPEPGDDASTALL